MARCSVESIACFIALGRMINLSRRDMREGSRLTIEAYDVEEEDLGNSYHGDEEDADDSEEVGTSSPAESLDRRR